MPWKCSMNDTGFEARIVRLILSGESEKALEALSRHYGVETPKLRVGAVKGKVRNPAVYVARTKTIHVSDAEGLSNPQLILHEFYHHLRTREEKHRGTEKHADRFAEHFVSSYAEKRRSTFSHTLGMPNDV